MLPRFFISTENLQAGEVLLTGDQAHKICHVLRLKAGQNIILLDNTGYEFEAALTSVAKDQVTAKVLEKRPAAEPAIHLTLYQSLLAREKFEWVLQKCTEVGVSRFVPVVTGRTIVRDSDHTKPAKLNRWRSIITAAAEQSHRGRIPELNHPIKLEEAIARLAEYDLSLMASTQPDAFPLRNCLQKCNVDKSTRIALLIGPEGGFTEQEQLQAAQNGATCFNLGPRILRTETAAMIASALILYELEEFLE
jgi:16S rRNA (uracil1498-N3)-methyltransferase